MSTSAVGRPVQLVRWQRAAADPRSAACTLAFGSIVVLGFLDGGYYPSTWSWAAVALVAIAGIQVVLGRAASPSRLALISSTALAALAAWMLLSSTWGVDGTEAGREAQRALTYAAALVALLSVSRAATARALLAGTLGGILVLAAFGLGARVLGAPQIDPFQGALLKEPVGYANSLGILTAIGVVVAVGLALEASGSPRRSAFLGAAGISGLALALTSSRGAWLALVVGLGVLASARVRSAWIVGALAAAGAVLVLVAITHVPLGDRPAYWRVAAEDFSQHRLLGSGAGSFDDVWLDARPIPAYVRRAQRVPRDGRGARARRPLPAPRRAGCAARRRRSQATRPGHRDRCRRIQRVPRPPGPGLGLGDARDGACRARVCGHAARRATATLSSA